MRLGWLSDIHLDHLDEPAIQTFLAELASAQVDAWLLGGDIGEADTVIPFLHRLNDRLPAKIYFVLGNHDFYGGSLADVRQRISAMESETLIWLTAAGTQLLTDSVALVGDDTWADARLGDPRASRIQIQDWFLIEELMALPRRELILTMNRFGDESAARLAPKLDRAAQMRENVVVLLHVPPFREATWHEGKPGSDEWLPWFACKAVGDTILHCDASHPQTRFLVLCGHTHGAGVFSPTSNVRVQTAGATYGAPAIQQILEFP